MSSPVIILNSVPKSTVEHAKILVRKGPRQKVTLKNRFGALGFKYKILHQCFPHLVVTSTDVRQMHSIPEISLNSPIRKENKMSFSTPLA